METKDKKRLVLIIISVAFLICVVAFATYAYFSVPIQNDFSETKINGTIEDIGNVSLLPEVNELALNLKASDMMLKEDSIAYYGTKEGTTEVESTEVIAKASVTGPGVFNCTYDLTMNATGEKNMYEAVQSMSTKEGNVILTVNGVRYDFGDSNLFPKTIKGEIKGLTEENSQDITAQIRLVNRKDLTQDELQGTDIEVSFTMQNFKCEAIEMGSAGAYVMKTSPANISTDLVEGLYRYQSGETDVTNNWFCANSTCSKNSMFRIIGVTPDGKLKMVSAAPLFIKEWHTEDKQNISWPYSSLYNYLNNEFKNSYPSEQMALLEDREWKYGDFGIDKYKEFMYTERTESLLISDFTDVEKSFNNTINATFGLLTLTDMLSQYNCGEKLSDAFENCRYNWLDYSSYFSTTSSNEHEWSMTKIGYGRIKDGIVSGIPLETIGNKIFYGHSFSYHNNVTSKWAVRPVFYFKSNLSLTGTGTETDPYRILVEE